jgi:uncharacterized protein (TIGR02246 family)
MPAATPAETHRLWVDAFNNGDVEALLPLYEDDAVFAADTEGTILRGKDAIRQGLEGFIATGGKFHLEEPKAHEGADVALVYTRWRFEGGSAPDGSAMGTLTGQTTDIVRRGSDGAWRFAVDNPWGVAAWQ